MPFEYPVCLLQSAVSIAPPVVSGGATHFAFIAVTAYSCGMQRCAADWDFFATCDSIWWPSVRFILASIGEADHFTRIMRRLQDVKRLDPIKVALPQDEFYCADLYSEFCNELHIDAFCSVAEEETWSIMYRRLTNAPRFYRALTGYIDERQPCSRPAGDVASTLATGGLESRPQSNGRSDSGSGPLPIAFAKPAGSARLLSTSPPRTATSLSEMHGTVFWLIASMCSAWKAQVA